MYQKPIYYNMFHVCEHKSPPVPCLDPHCDGTGRRFDLVELRALVEYRLRLDPTASMKVTCGKCQNTWSYDHQTVLALMPDKLKPRSLPDDCAWAIIITEVPTTDQMPQRAFIGERVLVAELKHNPEKWTGTLISESQIIPEIADGTMLGGLKMNGFLVALYSMVNGTWIRLPHKDIPQNSDVGAFFLPKTGDQKLLECTSPFCTNPSCGHIFGITHKEYEQQVANTRGIEDAVGQGTQTYMTLKCEICQTACIADSKTFRNLFRE